MTRENMQRLLEQAERDQELGNCTLVRCSDLIDLLPPLIQREMRMDPLWSPDPPAKDPCPSDPWTEKENCEYCQHGGCDHCGDPNNRCRCKERK